MAYYIGVDGGGTKTVFAVFDENKNMVATVKGPGSNHENMEGSFDEASEIIWDGIKAVVKEANISLTDVKFTLMGLAGIDHEFQNVEVSKRLLDYGLDNFKIFNDGFIVVKAGASSGAAIGYNAGTGTCCNAIDSTGKMMQLGGLGDCSGDKGNGHWIAAQTFKLIYDDLYLGINKTLLTKLFYTEFDISAREEFMASVSQLETPEADKYIMKLIDIFFEAAAQGDEPVLSVIDEMAQRGAEMISAHVRGLTFNDEVIEVVLSGSIHTKLPNEIYLKLLAQKATEQSGRSLKFVKLQEPPVQGCINWIFQNYKD